MKKYIISLCAVILSLCASAKSHTPWPRPTSGTFVNYTMAAYDYYDEWTEGLSIELCFSDDGKYVYFNNLFPKVSELNDVWHRGTVNGNTITLSMRDTVFYYDYYEDNNPIPLFLGIINESTIRDLVFQYDTTSGRIWIEDSKTNPQHFIMLFNLYEDIPSPWYYMAGYDMKPATTPKPGTIPATAIPQPYVYYKKDAANYPMPVQDTLWVDGNDYYFTRLCSPKGVLKGTRSGSTITFTDRQFIGQAEGYYLYVRGGKAPLEFNINAENILSLADPENYVLTTLSNGKSYDSTFVQRLTPYLGPVAATPSAPYELSLRYVADEEAYRFAFNLDAIDTEGNYLCIDSLSYRIFLDEDQYEFRAGLFNIDHHMLEIPFRFVDNYERAHSINWYNHGAILWLPEDLFHTIRVQAIYKVGTDIRTSEIQFIKVQ